MKTKLQFKDLIEDLYYAGIYQDNRYIFQKIGTCCEVPYMNPANKTFKRSGNLFSAFDNKGGYEFATQKEIDHFIQCKNANKFEPYSSTKTIDNYLILN